MLSTDHDFTAFLASRDLRRLVLERPVPDFRTVRTREYDAATVRCMAVLHPAPVAVRDPVHVHDVHDVHDVHHVRVAITATTRSKFTFTDAQIAIAIAVQARQLQKAS